MRTLLSLALAAVLIALPGVPAHAQEIVYNEYDTLAALDGSPDVIACIVYHETDPKWNPYSVGAAGELGVAQLHPRGELIRFMTGDWTPLPSELRNAFNPYQSVAYLEWYGRAHDWQFGPWTTWWRYCR